MRTMMILAAVLISIAAMGRDIKVVDAESREPLSMAPVFDKDGNYVLVADKDGIIRDVEKYSFPLTVRFMGYDPATIASPDVDVVAMNPAPYELKASKVSPGDRPVMRMVCYLREFVDAGLGENSLIGFGESMGDYFVPVGKARNFSPRLKMRSLSRKVYARFTLPSKGIDSLYVSNDTSYTMASFSEIMDKPISVPSSLQDPAKSHGTFSVKGKSAPKELWTKSGSKLTYVTDLLAKKRNHSRSPFITKLFGVTVDINEISVCYVFNNLESHTELLPQDISNFSINFAANASGRLIRKKLKTDGTASVRAYYEVYVVDREYLTVAGAKELIKNRPDSRSVPIVRPDGVPKLDAATLKLIQDAKKTE